MNYDVFIYPKDYSEYMKEEINCKVYDLLCQDFYECFENMREISSIFNIVYWHCSRIMYEEEPGHDYYNRYFHPECKYRDMYAVSFYKYEYSFLIVNSIYSIISMQKHIDDRLSRLLNRIENDDFYGIRVEEIKPKVERFKKEGICYSTDFTANIIKENQESLLDSTLLDDNENGYHVTRGVIDEFFGGDIKYAQQIVSLLEPDLQKRVIKRISQLLEDYHLVQNTPLAYKYDGLHYDDWLKWINDCIKNGVVDNVYKYNFESIINTKGNSRGSFKVLINTDKLNSIGKTGQQLLDRLHELIDNATKSVRGRVICKATVDGYLIKNPSLKEYCNEFNNGEIMDEKQFEGIQKYYRHWRTLDKEEQIRVNAITIF